ncbi:MAG: site-specific integrase [Roseburia faecis]|jgi:site-specific recombinase XerD|nr:site-specific integrase [Roseburia faecis]
MITDVNELIRVCLEELVDRQYKPDYIRLLTEHWNTLSQWMEANSLTVFSSTTAERYCDLHIGSHILTDGMGLKAKQHLRAIRMLVSYQKDGEFEFRSPRREFCFSGQTGGLMLEFFDYAADELHRAASTVYSYQFTLDMLNRYLERRNLSVNDISADDIECFLKESSSTIRARHTHANSLRQFFRYLYYRHYSRTDLSLYVLPDNCNRHSIVPTTYTEEEIRRIINAPDRSSAIGKRDYLVLLLAAEYGWRSADITGFRLDQIDWEKNVIRFEQQKTGAPVEYPLLSSVGNALIDYIQHGRPDSKRPEVILSAEKSKNGSPLKSPTIHSIVSRYMRKASITGWKEKKHGAHSLRHSLATNMLKKNVSLPVISTVLGHQTTETTKIYLKVDTNSLRSCALKMPGISTPYFRKAGGRIE